jgi:hypothetical protein
MVRNLDREIQSWSRGSARAQLALLWEEVERDGVRSLSWWERDEWSSPYLVSCTQSRLAGAGKWRAFCMVNFGQPGKDELLFSDDHEVIGRSTPADGLGAREVRRMLDLPGIDERPELCDLLISIGVRRDEIDIPVLNRFAAHVDEVVRYVVLGMLSWQPGVSNSELVGKFGEDADPKVRDLALRLSSGRTRRRTRV